MEKEIEYKCEQCNYTTNRKGDYTMHCKSKKHLTGTSKKYPDGYNCNKYNYKSINPHNYESHYLNNHGTSNERQLKFTYYCVICDCGSFSKRNYDMHMKTKHHIKRVERSKKV